MSTDVRGWLASEPHSLALQQRWGTAEYNDFVKRLLDAVLSGQYTRLMSLMAIYLHLFKEVGVECAHNNIEALFLS